MDARDQIPEELLRETDALRRVARGILFEPALAEDAVQEAWLAALRSQRREARSGGWLTEAVRRIARGMRRQDSRRTRREHTAARNEAQPSAADSASRVELLRELLDALESLEEPNRTAVQLRLLEDLPPRAIAERLGVPVETARTRVKRGIEKLRAHLDARNAPRRGEFLAALAPLALPSGLKLGVGAYAVSKTILGGVMSAQVKLVSAAAVVLLVAGIFWTHPWSASEPQGEGAQPPVQPSAAMTLPEGTEKARVEPPAASATASSTERRAEAAAGGSWVLRGRATKNRTQAFAGAEVLVSVVRGYEGPGETLVRQSVRAGDDGRFSLALDAPQGAVRVRAGGELDGYLCYGSEELVLAGAPAPESLRASFYALDIVLRGRVVDTEGAPIRAAHVQGHGRAAVETDADGRFTLGTSSALDSTWLTAWAEGFSESRTTLAAHAAGEVNGLELRLAPCAVLHGRVVDENGAGLEGAEVHCWPTGHAETKSGAGGKFTLPGVPAHADWLSVSASLAGYAHARSAFPEGKLPAEELVLTLARGAELSGVVVDDTGRPQPGAEVFTGPSRSDIDSLRALAGDEGRFSIRDVPRTTRKLRAEFAGFAPAALDLELSAGNSPRALTLVLKRGRSASGVVVDERGAPLEGVNVYARRDYEYLQGLEAQTDREGKFTLAGLPDVRLLALEFVASGYARRTLPLEGTPLDGLRVVLARAGALAGRVLDARTGKPVEAFRVRFVRAKLEPGERELGSYEATWGELGHEFHSSEGAWSTQGSDFEAGLVVGLEIRAPGYGPSLVPHALFSLDPERTPIEVRLDGGARLSGRVLDKLRGVPIAGARVRHVSAEVQAGAWMWAAAAPDSETLSDASGAFAFEALPLEPLSLCVEAPGFAPLLEGPIAIDAHGAERSLELVPGATLRGVLRSAEGAPLAHETISVFAQGGSMGSSMRSWSLETDAQGRFELADLAPAQYTAARMLKFDLGGVNDLSQALDVSEARVYELELRPHGSGRVSGTLQCSDALPEWASIDAELSQPGSNSSIWRAALAHQGHFEFEGLEAGHWRLMAREWGAGPAPRTGVAEVDVSASGTSKVTIDLHAP